MSYLVSYVVWTGWPLRVMVAVRMDLRRELHPRLGSRVYILAVVEIGLIRSAETT